MLKIDKHLNSNVRRYYKDAIAVIHCKERYGLLDFDGACTACKELSIRFGNVRVGRGRRIRNTYLKAI